MEPGAPAAGEFGRILAAMRRDGFAGFVSVEHCSGQGEPRDAVAAGRKMLAEIGAG